MARPVSLEYHHAAGEIVVQHALHVALEHLQRKDDGTSGTTDGVEQPEFGAMRFGVIVLFAKEHHIARGRTRDKRFKRNVSTGGHCDAS